MRESGEKIKLTKYYLREREDNKKNKSACQIIKSTLKVGNKTIRSLYIVPFVRKQEKVCGVELNSTINSVIFLSLYSLLFRIWT